jgi:hypothetical protein
MTYRIAACYQLILICNNYILFEIASCEYVNNSIFYLVLTDVFLPGYVALIRDNGIFCETLIFGYLLMLKILKTLRYI